MGWVFNTRDLTPEQEKIVLDYIKNNDITDIDAVIVKFEKEFECTIDKMYLCKLILHDNDEMPNN